MDTGRITINGEEIRFRSPQEAQNLGIGTVYREISLRQILTVVENPCSRSVLDLPPRSTGNSDVSATQRQNGPPVHFVEHLGDRGVER